MENDLVSYELTYNMLLENLTSTPYIKGILVDLYVPRKCSATSEFCKIY